MKRYLSTATVVLLSCLTVSAAAGEKAVVGDGPTAVPEWTQWRGPARDNISKETGLLKKWPEGGPKLLWTATGCGFGYSSVAVAGGMIYTAGTTENQSFVVAFDYKGQQKWKSPNGTPWKASPKMKWARNYNGARCTPSVSDGLVYYLNELGRLAAFEAGTGKEVWAIDITKEFEAKFPVWGYSESMLIDGDNLVVYAGGKKGSLAAVNKKTGKVVWTNTKIGEPIAYCTPILVEDKGLRQIISMSGISVFGVDAGTGDLLWKVGFKTKHNINVSSPIYKDGLVFVSNGYGGGSMLVQLNVEGKKVTPKEMWRIKAPDNHHGGVVLVGDHVYASGHNKKGWYCVDFKTGKTAYSDRSVEKGAITFAEGMLYLYGKDGSVALVKANPERFELVSRFKAPKGGEGAYWAHPVVCDGRLYLRHADKLFAYDIKERK